MPCLHVAGPHVVTCGYGDNILTSAVFPTPEPHCFYFRHNFNIVYSILHVGFFLLNASNQEKCEFKNQLLVDMTKKLLPTFVFMQC